MDNKPMDFTRLFYVDAAAINCMKRSLPRYSRDIPLGSVTTSTFDPSHVREAKDQIKNYYDDEAEEKIGFAFMPFTDLHYNHGFIVIKDKELADKCLILKNNMTQQYVIEVWDACYITVFEEMISSDKKVTFTMNLVEVRALLRNLETPDVPFLRKTESQKGKTDKELEIIYNLKTEDLSPLPDLFLGCGWEFKHFGYCATLTFIGKKRPYRKSDKRVRNLFVILKDGNEVKVRRLISQKYLYELLPKMKSKSKTKLKLKNSSKLESNLDFLGQNTSTSIFGLNGLIKSPFSTGIAINPQIPIPYQINPSVCLVGPQKSIESDSYSFISAINKNWESPLSLGQERIINAESFPGISNISTRKRQRTFSEEVEYQKMLLRNHALGNSEQLVIPRPMSPKINFIYTIPSERGHRSRSRSSSTSKSKRQRSSFNLSRSRSPNWHKISSKRSNSRSKSPIRHRSTSKRSRSGSRSRSRILSPTKSNFSYSKLSSRRSRTPDRKNYEDARPFDYGNNKNIIWGNRFSICFSNNGRDLTVRSKYVSKTSQNYAQKMLDLLEDNYRHLEDDKSHKLANVEKKINKNLKTDLDSLDSRKDRELSKISKKRVEISPPKTNLNTETLIKIKKERQESLDSTEDQKEGGEKSTKICKRKAIVQSNILKSIEAHILQNQKRKRSMCNNNRTGQITAKLPTDKSQNNETPIVLKSETVMSEPINNLIEDDDLKPNIDELMEIETSNNKSIQKYEHDNLSNDIKIADSEENMENAKINVINHILTPTIIKIEPESEDCMETEAIFENNQTLSSKIKIESNEVPNPFHEDNLLQPLNEVPNISQSIVPSPKKITSLAEMRVMQQKRLQEKQQQL